VFLSRLFQAHKRLSLRGAALAPGYAMVALLPSSYGAIGVWLIYFLSRAVFSRMRKALRGEALAPDAIGVMGAHKGSLPSSYGEYSVWFFELSLFAKRIGPDKFMLSRYCTDTN